MTALPIAVLQAGERAMIDRRTLLYRAAATGAGVAMLGVQRASALPLGLAAGIQLWAVKDALAKDFAGTLKQLHALGYRTIEAAGWQGFAPAEFAKRVRGAGLEPVSCHFSMHDLTGSDLKGDFMAKLVQAKVVGVDYIVASAPALTAPLDPALPWIQAMAKAMTLADWRANAQQMNILGAAAKAMDMRFAYHNHAGEFLYYEGVHAFQEILRLTDPALVAIELDLGWVALAGLDPAKVLEAHARRIELLHVRDVATTKRTPHAIAQDLTTVSIGTGSIDWRKTFAAARAAPIKHWFIEQEAPFQRPELAEMADSIAYLRTLG
jgi:sugar phosphate isomerase/epimerase